MAFYLSLIYCGGTFSSDVRAVVVAAMYLSFNHDVEAGTVIRDGNIKCVVSQIWFEFNVTFYIAVLYLVD